MKPYIHMTVKLAGVTFEGRQGIIAGMSVYEQMTIRRDRNNAYDRNAIGIYNSRNQNIGWIPRDIAANLAPKMDAGATLFAKVHKKSGGNGYPYGVEVFISTDKDLVANHQPEVPRVQPMKTSSYASTASSTYNRRSYLEDDDDYSSSRYFWDESDRDSDDYDPSEDWTDLYEYNENH